MSLVINNNNITGIAIGNRDIIRITDSNSNVLWEKVKPCCGSGIPDDEVWYKQNNTAVPIYPFRPYGQNNSWFRCEDNETKNYIISNTYDSSDGWWKIKWSCDFYQTVGSGWYTKTEITEVILPDSFDYDQAECWNNASGITKITYGSGTTKLDEGACPPNVTDIYFYGATPPDLNPSNDGRGNYFRLHSSLIPVTVHIPQGCSWSSIASQLPNYVTVVDDLYCEIPGNWLTFTSNDASARVKLLKEGNSAQYYLLTETFQYSVDEGTTWSQYTPDTYITVNLGDSVCFRGNNSGPFCKEEDNSSAYWVFETDGSFAVSGDVTSLMNKIGGDIALPPRAFENMFSYSDITSAPNLPSTTISAYCYCQMFKMCTNLVTPPALPATTLAEGCYYFMFYGCESMTSAPVLSSTNLAALCYANMFQNCESLTTPPALPATTLADSCYSSMFLGSAITTAPALPATILTTGCYSNMFRSCHSLTVGPVLPATTLVTNCYDRMFLLDENLVDITTYATTWDTAKAYQWLDGVAASGTFHNLGMATIPTNDSSGIPTGWTEIVGQCDTPVCSFVDGIYGSGCNNYNGTAVMTINCATAGATIYYKIGSGNFETYSSPVTLTTGSQTITTYATKANYTDSNNGTYSHTVPADQGQCVSDPLFRYEAVNGTASITLPYNSMSSSACKFSSNGTTWTNTSNSNKTRSLNDGEKLYVRLNIPSIASANTTTITINSGTVKIAGKLSTLTNNGSETDNMAVGCNISSLFAGQTGIVDASDLIVNVKPSNNTTKSTKAMFNGCTGLVNPPQLPLTLGTTSEYTGCYSEMFSGCTSLQSSPALPSTVVPEEGYKDMFTNCTALTTAGAISAITVGDSGMRNMFNNCTHLTTAPSLAFTSVGINGCNQMFYDNQSLVTPPATLPATTLSSGCYQSMFKNCFALTSAPSLPATNLAERCYYEMFANCGNLTTAPDLPAVTMQNGCYTAMFSQCSSLSSINVKITDWNEVNAGFWVSGVAQSGTFTKPSSLVVGTGTGEIPDNSANGIPTGWMVVNV